MEGVVGAITGARTSPRPDKPFGVGVTAPVHYYATAIDKVRFVGEPVAVVVARDRYLAEDAAEMVVGRLRAAAGGGRRRSARSSRTRRSSTRRSARTSPGNRRLVYGDPDRAFAEADVVVPRALPYPKYGSTPIETYGVIARWDPLDGVLTIWSNFMGPFIMHPLAARVLGAAREQAALHRAARHRRLASGSSRASIPTWP